MRKRSKKLAKKCLQWNRTLSLQSPFSKYREKTMFELLALLLECRTSGTLPPELSRRVDTVVKDTLAQCDALLGWQDEMERLE